MDRNTRALMRRSILIKLYRVGVVRVVRPDSLRQVFGLTGHLAFGNACTIRQVPDKLSPTLNCFTGPFKVKLVNLNSSNRPDLSTVTYSYFILKRNMKLKDLNP